MLVDTPTQTDKNEKGDRREDRTFDDRVRPAGEA